MASILYKPERKMERRVGVGKLIQYVELDILKKLKGTTCYYHHKALNFTHKKTTGIGQKQGFRQVPI
jgi:hypothetical protein